MILRGFERIVMVYSIQFSGVIGWLGQEGIL